MSYQVLARKWRPQRFDDVIGQRGVTQTLRNAIAAKRIAQSFVFSGPRGVGKTTTARILARCLNCLNGPTADPCGVCDACVEIAQGRDIDVIEIDAATNTQVEKVREVIISGLGMSPVRNRYKVFIIDEVHRLSAQSFDALLKSIEEPPPHVVFMMATTEIDKVPPTIQSRSQVFELKTIGLKQIADQLRKIADAEALQVDDASLMLVARAGDGSMRDAQSALDQVIAFAGRTIAPEDVASVLGLVQRDLLFDIAEAVAAEDAAAVFDLSGRVLQSGYEPRSVIRELSRLTRDLLLLRIDPARLTDPEIAAEGERDRLRGLAPRFSSEDLMRAFDVLTKVEADIRGSAQPRYHLEMALLRWIHLRKLTPLSALIESMEKGAPPARPSALKPPPGPVRPAPAQPLQRAQTAAAVRSVEARRDAPGPSSTAPSTSTAEAPDLRAAEPGQLKDLFLDEVRKAKKYFHGTVVAMAQKIEAVGDALVFTFGPHHRVLRSQLDQNRPWLEEMASKLAGRRMVVSSAEGTPAPASGSSAPAAPAADPQREALKQQALENAGVQAMLDVFAAEIKEVEER